MNILSLENVSKDFGVKPLFENVTLGLEDSNKIGIIGANGSGKTTFLRVVAGLEQPDTGKVVRANGKSLAYLSQNPVFDDDSTVLEMIFASSSGIMKMLQDYEIVCHELEASDADHETLLEKMSELQHQLEQNGGWEIETNARAVLTRLGIHDMTAKMRTLSGGQRKRVALAHELIFKPDILILDEPTNHLDADTIEWLEKYLANYRGALLLVTHDRYFLDRVTNRIFEIDRGMIQPYAGNYAYYLEKKEEQETLRETEGHKREQRIKKELAWLRTGAKARTRKSKARIDAANELINAPKERKKDELDIQIGAKRLGSKVVELENVSKSYGDRKLINDFTHIFKRSDRIGVIGANGAGKTTLLEIITNRIKPDSGEVVIGQTVKIGYYDQESRALNEEQRVIDYIKDAAEYVTTADGKQITASRMLENFLFPTEAQYSFVGKLSGGERRRLYLLRMLMTEPNVLLLDEPTNDLDIPTLVALEDYLDDFKGALIVVSHDRYFLDRTIETVFRFEGEAGEIRQYPGDYTAYLEYKQRAEEVEKSNGNQVAKTVKTETVENKTETKQPNKLSFKEQRELETLEKSIAAAESRQTEIQTQLTVFASDAGKLNELFGEQQKLNKQLETEMERWAKLAERAG